MSMYSKLIDGSEWPNVINQLKTSLSDAGPNEVVKIAFALSKNVLEKKLKQLTDL